MMSCCLSPAGMGAVVAGPANSTFLSSMCQLAPFEFAGGLGGWWEGAADAPAALCPHRAQHPWPPPRLSSPRPQVPASVP